MNQHEIDEAEATEQRQKHTDDDISLVEGDVINQKPIKSPVAQDDSADYKTIARNS